MWQRLGSCPFPPHPAHPTFTATVVVVVFNCTLPSSPPGISPFFGLRLARHHIFERVACQGIHDVTIFMFFQSRFELLGALVLG